MIKQYKLSEEEKKLFKDPNWRLDNLYKIKDKNKRITKFKKNKIQNILHKNISGFDMVLKPRQVGISTYFLLKKLDATIFNENYTACILSHKRDSMEKLFSIVRRAYKHMHPSIQPVVDKGGGSRFEMRFPEIDSKIYCTMEAVSDTVNDLHISEMALMEKDDRVSTSMDAVPLEGGIISIETTPRGFNHFYKFWNDPDNFFKKHFFPWVYQDEYKIPTDKIIKPNQDEIDFINKTKRLFDHEVTQEQLAFRRAKIKQKKGKAGYLQEFAEDERTCFIASGDTAFDLEIISDLLNNLEEPIEQDDTIELFRNFNSNRRYAVGADTAQGVSGDYSVATVFDIDSMEQVAQIRSNKWRPREFAHKIYDLCRRFHKTSREWPLLGVELNNHGHAVLLELEEHLAYPNLFAHKEGQAGWKTDMVTRPLMIDAFIDGVENGTVKINSRNTLNECLTLIDNKGKIEAEDGEHDDCVIASAIAIQMCIGQRSNLDIYNDLSSKILL